MIVVAISGASGSILGIRLIEELLNQGERVTGVLSSTARKIISHEIPHALPADFQLADLIRSRERVDRLDQFTEYANTDFFAAIASGSTPFEAVVVMPCSMKTLSAVANGYANTLTIRACDVALKENRKCILVPRETPLNLIHIENMKKAVSAGAMILPPMPGFYTLPKTIDDVVDFIVGKALNLLGREHRLFNSWEEQAS